VNNTMLKQLPAPDDEMRAAGLEGRWFIGVGNHEVWGDPKIEGTLSAVPSERLIYKFDFKDVRFSSCDSGWTRLRPKALSLSDRSGHAIVVLPTPQEDASALRISADQRPRARES
jgi:hypothetical protein